MDNTIIPYQDVSDLSSEDLSDSSSDDEHSHLLSNNIGVHYNKFNTGDAFMNMEDPKDYVAKRNRLFTPEITKRIFTVKLDVGTNPTTFSLKNNIKLPTNNIIGFKIMKSVFLSTGNILNIDLSVPEIPEIACDKNDDGENIIARIPLSKGTTNYYTHQYLELSLIDRYFFPLNLDTLTFTLSDPLTGFVVIELSYFNDQVKKI